MSDALVDLIAQTYDDAQARKKELRAEVRAKYKERADAEIRELEDAEDARVGSLIVKARAGGAKRADLAKAIRSNDNGKMRRLIELGGGELRVKRDGVQIEADRLAEEEANRPLTEEEREGVFSAAGLVETHEGGLWWPEGNREVRFMDYQGVPRLTFLEWSTFNPEDRVALVAHDEGHRDELVALFEMIEREKE